MKFIFSLLILLNSFSVYAATISKVGFQQEGEISKLIIQLDEETAAERFHLKNDKQIILDIKNAQGTDRVLRAIDTSEFTGATVYISGYKKPGSPKDTRFAIQLRDNVRSRLNVMDNQIVLEIENRFGAFQTTIGDLGGEGAEQSPVQAVGSTGSGAGKILEPKSNQIEDILENLTMSGRKKYIGKRITINVQNIKIEDLLRMIADISGFNIIIDDEVIQKSKPLTLSLNNIPWDEALDTIMEISKLVASKNGNILTVKTVESATKEIQERIKTDELTRTQEPLVTKIFPISFAELEEMSKILEDYKSERGRITFDKRTAHIIVKDTVANIERMKKIVEFLDTQTAQVLIESKIVEAIDEYGKNIGLSNGLQFGYDPITNTGVGSEDAPTFTIAQPAPSVNAGVNLAGATSPLGGQLGPGFSFNTAPTDDNPGIVGVSVTVFKRLFGLGFSLNLLEFESKVRIVSSPKIITQDNKEATITSSNQTSYQVQTLTDTGVTIGYQPVTADVTLKVTPKVTNEGSISMKVDITKSGFGTTPTAGAPPNQTSRSVNTNVLVDNGSTIVIGGLYQTQNSESHSGVPWLKDIPLLGWLFRTPHNPRSQRNELIIFLTPRIINQEEAGLSGSEESVLN